MQKFLPFLQWLPNYKSAFFKKDLIAGLTVAIVLIPQAMAYAMLAGLPPVYGLYASVFPLLIYAFLGTSRQLGIGPVAMDSLLVAAGLGALVITGIENYIAMAIFLAFVVGAIQVLLGVFRMGFLVNFLSKPVLNGFTSGAVLIIMLSQIKHLMGVEVSNSSKFHTLLSNIAEKISEINMYDLAIGIAAILLILLLKKWSKKIPAILIAVVLGIMLVNFLGLDSKGVKIVGAIPAGLPSFQIPEFNLDNLLQILPIAFTIALVGYLEAISIGKAIEERNNETKMDANQELVALGASNIVGSFFQSYPVAASFSRSAINNEMGSKSNLSGLITMTIVVITLFFLAPLFYYLPNAILAAIIMVSVYRLIDFEYPRALWKNRKDEFAVLLLTFLITLFIGIPQGILTGVLLSLLLMVYRTSNPHFAVLGNIRNTDYYKNINRFGEEIIVREDLLIVRFDARLYFGNMNFFKRELLKNIDAKGENLKGIILNAEAINYIDSSAATMLIQVIEEIHARGLKFIIAGAIGPTRDIIFRSGIIDALHKEFLFVRTKEAVACFDDPGAVSSFRDIVAYQKN